MIDPVWLIIAAMIVHGLWTHSLHKHIAQQYANELRIAKVLQAIMEKATVVRSDGTSYKPQFPKID